MWILPMKGSLKTTLYDKLQILNSYLEYNKNMHDFLTHALRDGPNLDIPMPKPPKAKLQSLFGPKQENNTSGGRRT